MKKKILLTIAASALLTTSVLAYNGQGCQQQGINKGCSQKQMNTGCGNKMMQKNKMGHKKGNKIRWWPSAAMRFCNFMFSAFSLVI